MLATLKIKNFQAHASTRIDFDSNITVITASSDRGKSSILRALKLIAVNRPSGNSFVRHGTDAAKISLTIDGHQIRRVKGKSVNSYSIDGKKLVAFKNDVPKEVADLLNLSEINFQGQHDAPFWFSQSPGQVAKELNSIVNLEVIDQTMANLNSQVRNVGAEIRVIRDRLKEAKLKRASLRYAKEMKADFKRLEGLESKSLAMGLEASRIDDLVSELGRYRAEAKSAGELRGDGLETIQGMKDRWVLAQERGDELETIISELWILDRDRIDSEKEIDNLQKELRKGIGETCPLCNQKVKVPVTR